MKFSIYLAGKIPKGKENDNYVDWRKDFIEIMEEKRKNFPNISKVVYLDPHVMKGDIIPSVDFFGRDVHMVAISDCIIVDARAKIGAGVAQEILIAKYYGKPVVTVVPNNSHYHKKTNVMGSEIDYRHPFIFSSSDVVVQDFKQAVDCLLKHFLGERMDIKGIDILDLSQKYYLENHFQKDESMKEWKEEMK